MKFILNKDNLEIDDEQYYYSGSVAYYEADIEYDESWKNLIIEAIIIKRGEEAGETIAVIDNKMYIDQKLSGMYFVGFVGYSLEEEEKVYQISSNLKSICFSKGAGEIDAKNTELPTPTEWEIYIAQLKSIVSNIEGLSEELNSKVSEVEKKLEDGELDGEDGFSPIAKVTETEEGANIEITDKNGTTRASIKNGEKGEQGDPGYTPQKGIDYYTSAEKEEFENGINERVDDAINDIQDKTEEYNQNAIEKTNEYNQNATEKEATLNDLIDDITDTFTSMNIMNFYVDNNAKVHIVSESELVNNKFYIENGRLGVKTYVNR